MESSSSNIEPSKKSRIEFIDLAKGVCILLVILHHCGLGFYPLSMLRMPLYFILSGLFFKDYGIVETILKKINKLIIPIIFFYILGWSIYLLYCVLTGSNIKEDPLAILHEKYFICNSIWFLMALFWLNIIYLVLLRTLKKDSFVFFGVVLISAFGYWLYTKDTHPPFFIDSALFALPLFYFGAMIRKTSILYPSKYDKFLPAGIIIFGLLGVLLCISVKGKAFIGFHTPTLRGNIIINYIACIALVLSFMFLAKMIKRVPFISYIGRYSIILLGVHASLVFILDLIINDFGLSISPIIKFIVIFLPTVLSIPILIKYFPKFTAQLDLIPTNVFKNFKLEKKN